MGDGIVRVMESGEWRFEFRLRIETKPSVSERGLNIDRNGLLRQSVRVLMCDEHTYTMINDV
jgi:hypothetical protein